MAHFFPETLASLPSDLSDATPFAMKEIILASFSKNECEVCYFHTGAHGVKLAPI